MIYASQQAGGGSATGVTLNGSSTGATPVAIGGPIALMSQGSAGAGLSSSTVSLPEIPAQGLG
jgi:hypothetical protein